MNTNEEASKSIHLFVWSGFYDEEEIQEIICEEIFDQDELDVKWIKQEIRREFTNKKKEEKKWDKITDCDRLDNAFARLNEIGIIALQNAGYTQSDGLSDISEVYYESGGEQSDITGYCFFHGQDLERVEVVFKFAIDHNFS